MGMDKQALDIGRSIVRGQKEEEKAYIRNLIEGGQSEIAIVTIPLDTAVLETLPRELQYPFKGLYVLDATDAATKISARLNTNDKWQGKIDLFKKDVMNFDHQQLGMFLSWEAQTGKSITLALFISGNFKPGSQIIDTTSLPSSFSEQTAVSVLTTATLILAANSDRNELNLYNHGGSRIWLGGSGIAVDQGIPLDPGEHKTISNTAAIYGIAVGAASSVTMVEEV